MRVKTVILPQFLAPALVNGDTSGMTDEDKEWLDKALAYIGPGRVVGCGNEETFSAYCDLPGYHLGCDVLEYTVLYEGERPEVEPQNSETEKKFRADNATATAAGKKGVLSKPGDGVAKLAKVETGAFLRGYERGNYGAAYESQDWESWVAHNEAPAEFRGPEDKQEFRNGTLLGFFSSYELSEIGDELLRDYIKQLRAEYGVD